MFGSLFDSAVLAGRLAQVHSPDYDLFRAIVDMSVTSYVIEGLVFYASNRGNAEAQAYGASDSEDPQFLYQGYCPGHPDF
jgi:hypothetical protein